MAVGEISSGDAKYPSDLAIKATDKLINYFLTTFDKVLILGGGDTIYLFGFVDASYITVGKAKSRLGGQIFAGLASGAVLAFSKTAMNIAGSSTHAEVMAVELMVRLMELSRQLCKFLGYNMTEPSKIFVDNKSAIQLCETLKSTHITSSINMRRQYIREKINERQISLHFVPSKQNIADMMTKPVDTAQHEYQTDKTLTGFNNDSSILEDIVARGNLVIDDSFNWDIVPDLGIPKCCVGEMSSMEYCNLCQLIDC